MIRTVTILESLSSNYKVNVLLKEEKLTANNLISILVAIIVIIVLIYIIRLLLGA